MWQELIVAVMVLCAAVYALWQWLPVSVRARMGWAKPLLGKGAGCGACSDCGGCASKRPQSNFGKP